MTEEPAILALCCNWCGYNAADQAGAAKIPYPSAVKIVRLMCTGMVDPYYVLRAFERGVRALRDAGFEVIYTGCQASPADGRPARYRARRLKHGGPVQPKAQPAWRRPPRRRTGRDRRIPAAPLHMLRPSGC